MIWQATSPQESCGALAVLVVGLVLLRWTQEGSHCSTQTDGQEDNKYAGWQQDGPAQQMIVSDLVGPGRKTSRSGKFGSLRVTSFSPKAGLSKIHPAWRRTFCWALIVQTHHPSGKRMGEWVGRRREDI